MLVDCHPQSDLIPRNGRRPRLIRLAFQKNLSGKHSEFATLPGWSGLDPTDWNLVWVGRMVLALGPAKSRIILTVTDLAISNHVDACIYPFNAQPSAKLRRFQSTDTLNRALVQGQDTDQGSSDSISKPHWTRTQRQNQRDVG